MTLYLADGRKPPPPMFYPGMPLYYAEPPQLVRARNHNQFKARAATARTAKPRKKPRKIRP